MGCKGHGALACGFWGMGGVASVFTCFGVYIRYFGNGGWRFRSYSGSLSKSAKVTKALLPHHSAPRLGSVCPHSGIAPWARREGPSMAQRGYLGIHAEVPTTQYLRSASVVNGAPEINVHREAA
ncbi:hypothetical protein SRABI06_01220 [Pseudomonas brassicacearum]|nr:hypothetical protein SRABI06_01220 [Pseudomonas brassicacearum]